MNGATFGRLNSSARWLSTSSSLLPGSSRALPRTVGQRRRYVQAALKARPGTPSRERSQDEFATSPSNNFRKPKASYSYGESEHRPKAARSFGLTQRENVPDETFSDHLNGLFPGLQFPPQLASRILTHGSHPLAAYGHNGRLSFVGRRVMETYLLLLVSTSPNLQPSHDMDDIVGRTLASYFLGQHVGSSWGLGRVMRWSPAANPETLQNAADVEDTGLARKTGLYKVQGEAVAALVGGVYQNFGASTAHRLFHTRLLPNLIVGQGETGLPAAFHEDVRAACNRLGGEQGSLVSGGNAQKGNTTHLF